MRLSITKVCIIFVQYQVVKRQPISIQQCIYNINQSGSFW